MKKQIIAALVFALLITTAPFTYAASDSGNAVLDGEYLNGIRDMIQEKYQGENDDKKLLEGALKGMFGSLDPYTEYFTKEEVESFFTDINGSYEGIGIMIAKEGDLIQVVKVFPASPAEKAGILSGDKIVEVNGKNMVGASTDEVVSLIKGPAGSKVTLSILRGADGKVLKIAVARANIKVNPVSYEIKGDIGYIKLEVFNANADEYMKKALAVMDQKKIRKLILDLRDNPGGEVDQVVAIAKNFVPEGLITTLDFKSESMTDQEYRSPLKKLKYKVAVLVNGNSASASEILAGAIQDTKAGTLVGTKTFGKAKVQSIFPLLTPEAFKKYQEKLGKNLVSVEDLQSYGMLPTDDEVLGWAKVTTGMYTTPKGRMIDLKGLTPDVAVKDPELVGDIDIGSIQKLVSKTQINLNGENIDVYHAEKILKILKFDIGIPDMKLDKKTSDALKKFQKEQKINVNGSLDAATQKKLNEKADQILLEKDKQYSKAIELLKKQ